ncbi:MAG: histidine kinase dimerization/phospho-acceptor domain-containing protein, partial [Pseudomonadota bacterium]
MLNGLIPRLLILLISLALLNACGTADAPAQPKATAGVLDLRGWDFAQNPRVRLAGEWEFYWDILLPTEGGAPATTGALLQVPGSWSRQSSAGTSHSAAGHASYRLQLLLDPSAPSPLILRIPDVYSAYTLWVNGQKRSHVGEVATRAADARAASGERLIELEHDGTPIELLLHVSNYTSRHGGIVRAPSLGQPEAIGTAATRDKVIASGIFTAIFVLGLTQLVIYLFRHREPASLFFGLSSIIWAIRVLFEMQLLPALGLNVPITFAQRMDSSTLLLSALFYITFLRTAFPNEYTPWVLRLAWAFGISYLLIAIFAQPLTRGLLFQYYLWLVALLLLHGVYVTLRAALNQREGALLLLLSATAIALFGGFQILNLELSGTRAFYTSFGVLIFVMLNTILISRQAGHAFTRIEGLERTLRRANRLKDEFLANTSHELRTPLHGMVGIAESLQEECRKAPASAQDGLRLIIASGQRLGRLVDDILDFTRLRHDDLKCRPEAVDLAGTISTVLDTCRVLVGERPVELVSSVPSPSPCVTADPNRLQQILFNLVGNAVKFTDAGEVCV